MILRIAFLLLTTVFALSCDDQTKKNGTDAATTSATPVNQAIAPATPFDGERAFAHVKAMVEMGPRPAGSPAIEKTREYIIRTLKGYGLPTRVDEFTPVTPRGRIKMKNLIAEIPGESGDTIIISSHYDTKEFKEFRFVGANDGGSSSGVLLELARVMAADKKPRKFTYQFVFFDGEEAFCHEWSECLEGNDNTYGSRHMADQLRREQKIERTKAMILLDMIGDSDLAIPREENSSEWLVNAIWGTAREAGYQQNFLNKSHWLTDDHIPFLKAGIPSVDLIDFDYGPEADGYWHTAKDTLDKISAKSLGIVGDALLRSLPRIESAIH